MLTKKQPELIKFLKKLTIITIVVIIGLAIGIMLAGNSSSVKRLSSAPGSSGSRYVPAPAGSATGVTSYPADGVPSGGTNSPAVMTPLVKAGDQPADNLQAELSSSPYDLLPEHQQAYWNKVTNAYNTSSNPAQIKANLEAPTPPADLLAMQTTTVNFLGRYETFKNNEPYAAYQRSLLPYVVPNSIARIAEIGRASCRERV